MAILLDPTLSGRIVWAFRPKSYLSSIQPITRQQHNSPIVLSVARLLLFFQPVLLEARERRQARVSRVGLATALFLIQVRPAARAQTPALAPADHLQRQCQQHLRL